MSTRRSFLQQTVAAAAATAAGAAATLGSSGFLEAEQPQAAQKPASGGQRRWRTAFGLNGFMSSETEYENTFPIWDVLDFAQREGFEGIELVQGWPRGMYPAANDDARIDSLRGFLARYNVKAFSIQTSAGGAFRKERSAREAWLKAFAGWARFARKADCECIGVWPGGGLDGQSIEQGIARLVESLKEVAKIVSDEELLCSVEIEPPFVFNKIEHLIQILDGVDHPLVKGMYDPSHFDLMNGGKGKPEELLERLGVQRLGYIHLTDTDGTIFGGTSKHLACGDGHVDIHKSLEILWRGGYEGWIMIDPWKIKDPYDACHKGRLAIESARKEFWGKTPH